jgi:alpha/beta hydrolase family protein
VAKNADGSPLTGPVLVRFADMAANTNTLALRGRQPPAPMAPPLTLDTSKATLTRRAAEGREIIPIRSSDWAFADCGTVPFPGKPDPDKVCLKNGFDPAYLYELVYTAKDPLVLGIGFAATRDLTSFFRYAAKDDSGTANPVAGKVTHALARGDSQSGNFLRSMVHLGFNQDEAKKIVFDGINPNIAVRQLAMDFRFASPSGAAALYEPGSDAVQTWSSYTDDARHRPAASLLDRCTASNTCPKVFETFGASELWNLRGSTDLVGTKADKDIPLPAGVRRYFFPGVTHGGGTGGFSTNVPNPPRACELPNNPNPSSDTMRALTVALVDWVMKGTAPPPSQYPRLDHGDLVEPTQAALGFPIVPGVPLPDYIQLPLYEYDFGPKFNYNDMRGYISMEPPAIRQVLPSLAPKVDADGNETSGVASVLHQAPLGSYLGWNVTATGFNKGAGCGLVGGYVPFAKTKAERLAAGDPRLSLEERYSTHEKYVAAVRAAAAQLVHDRFLLKEDAERLITEATASNVLR